MLYQSTELRWFYREEDSRAIEDWFRSGATAAIADHWRTDYYLLGTGDSLTLKLRENKVEVKKRTGLIPDFPVDGVGKGELESWEKWSFDLGEAPHYEQLAKEHVSSWLPVAKRRLLRVFRPAGSGLAEVSADAGIDTGCLFELTLLGVAGQRWTTIGLEAFGPESDRQPLLVQTARSFFVENPPIPLDDVTSCGYATWIAEHWPAPKEV